MKAIAHVFLLAAAWAGPALSNHVPQPTRHLAPDSPFVKQLYDAPLPADMHEALVIAEILRLAHENRSADVVVRHVERATLLNLLGEIPPVSPPTLRQAIAEIPSEASLDALRVRLLEGSDKIEVLTAPDPKLAPKVSSYALRHDGRAVWTRLEGAQERERLIGVSVRNAGRKPVRGAFVLDIFRKREESPACEPRCGKRRSPSRSAISFGCRYEAVAPGESLYLHCVNGGTLAPLEELLYAVAGLESGQTHVGTLHREVAFGAGPDEIRIVRTDRTRVDFAMGDNDRAMQLVESQPCEAKGSCFEMMKAKAKDVLGDWPPFLYGFVLGLLPGVALLALGYFGSSSLAARLIVGLVITFGVLLAVAVAWIAVVTWQIHQVFSILLTALAAATSLQAFGGFTLGILLPILTVWKARDMLRRS